MTWKGMHRAYDGHESWRWPSMADRDGSWQTMADYVSGYDATKYEATRGSMPEKLDYIHSTIV